MKLEFDPHVMNLATKAMEEFTKYAAFDGQTFDESWQQTPLRIYQVRLGRWEVHNFGAQPLYRSALGMVEESCFELIESIETGQERELADSIADAFVFMCNACTLLRLDFHTIVQGFDVSYNDTEDPNAIMKMWWDLMKGVGRVAHVTLKEDQKIRGYDTREPDGLVKFRSHIACSFILLGQALRVIAQHNDLQMFLLFSAVSDQVLKRDFKKNAVTGGEVQS